MEEKAENKRENGNIITSLESHESLPSLFQSVSVKKSNDL